MSLRLVGGLELRGGTRPFLEAWMAKPDVVVEVVLVADESSVDDGIVDFFFPHLVE